MSRTEAQKDRRMLGQSHHGQVPQQERGFRPQKSPFDLAAFGSAFSKLLVAKAKLLGKKENYKKDCMKV